MFSICLLPFNIIVRTVIFIQNHFSTISIFYFVVVQNYSRRFQRFSPNICISIFHIHSCITYTIDYMHLICLGQVQLKSYYSYRKKEHMAYRQPLWKIYFIILLCAVSLKTAFLCIISRKHRSLDQFARFTRSPEFRILAIYFSYN